MNERDKQLSAAFHTPEVVIAGRPLRPMSLASYDVLLRLDNPLVKGAELDEDSPELLEALMGYIYAHCAPWREVVTHSFQPGEFRTEALVFCGELTPRDYKAAMDGLREQGRQLEAAQAKQASSIGKKNHPATSLACSPATSSPSPQ